MRVKLLAVLLIGCVVGYFTIGYGYLKSTAKRVLLASGLLLLFMFGSSFININILSEDKQAKVDRVVEQCGDTYIKIKGSEIYVKINGNWLNIDDIKIIGIFTESSSIEYEGKEIHLGESGVKSTIRVLDSLDMIESEK